ncbi:MAG: DUF1080 domain-containing protein [Proteobacteria bacterium]|nr:DUF1080 domain-containing protein [Pseudomonadota bacterium]
MNLLVGLVVLSGFGLGFTAGAADAGKAEPAAPGVKWKAGDMARPRPPVVTPPDWGSNDKPAVPPSDAIVLFDGTSLAKWKTDSKKPEAAADDAAKWKVENGYFEVVPHGGGIRTREKFTGDYQWHIEWATPAEVKGSSQGRGNSGVFIGGLPEVQVLDSYDNDTYPDGQASALYNRHPPYVNASRKPGQWQTYDIIVERAKVDAEGKVTQKARVTVLHNGLVSHHARELDTRAQDGDLALQDHGNPVRFRNIWLRKLNNDESANTPPPAPKK